MGKIKDNQEWYFAKLTDEAIEKSEREYPGTGAEMRQKRQEAQLKWFVNKPHLEHLDPYKSTPRDKSTKFVKKGCKASKKLVIDAPLVYCSVVQAGSHFFQPIAPWETFDLTLGVMVVLFTLDERYRYDKAWLSDLSQKVADTKKTPAVSADVQKLGENLLDTRSRFIMKIGASLAGDVTAWCCTVTVDAKHLPKNFIPDDQIIPFLVTKPFPEQDIVFSMADRYLSLINKEFYM